jgi:hypothetical protein
MKAMSDDLWLRGFNAGVAFTWPVASILTLAIAAACGFEPKKDKGDE